MLPSKPGNMLYHAVETSIVDTFRATITDECKGTIDNSLGHCLDSNYIWAMVTIFAVRNTAHWEVLTVLKLTLIIGK